MLDGRRLCRHVLRWSSEVITLKDAALQLANGNPLLWVVLKDHAKNVVQFIRQWQDGLQEIPVPCEGLICGILNRCLFPWIAPTCQVDKNDS